MYLRKSLTIQRIKKQKISLIIAILINLGVLVVIKVYKTSFGGKISSLSSISHYYLIRLIAPIGISYYTLQMISYLMDTSSGKIHSNHSILDFAVYASFFPTLIRDQLHVSTKIKRRHSCRESNYISKSEVW